jgi:hypothetical protein
VAISVLLRIESALRFCFLSLVQALLLSNVLLLPEASQAFHLSLELLLLLVRVALLLQLHSLLERELALLLGSVAAAAAAARLATATATSAWLGGHTIFFVRVPSRFLDFSIFLLLALS